MSIAKKTKNKKKNNNIYYIYYILFYSYRTGGYDNSLILQDFVS
mgnify:CR=1 FL=1